MDFRSRQGTVAAGDKTHARSVVLSELRTDLVRFHETGERSDKNPHQYAFTREVSSGGSSVE